MLDKEITVTYGELITVFNQWNDILESGKTLERPAGNNYGEMFTNYLISGINKLRAEYLTTYNK